MKSYLMLFVAILLVSCTSKAPEGGGPVQTPICSFAKSMADNVAKEVASVLSCSNQSAIAASLVEKLNDWKVCEPAKASAKAPQSIVGDLICPRVVDLLVTGAFKQIPKEWGCSGGVIKEAAVSKIIEVCRKSI